MVVPLAAGCPRRIAIALFALVVGPVACTNPASESTLRIGVVVQDDNDGLDVRALLGQAADVIARSDTGGHNITLEWIHQPTQVKETRALLDADRIDALIGPRTSAVTFELSPELSERGVVHVTPSATAASLFKAFATSPYFWRTVESDVAQAEQLVLLAAEDPSINKVALLTTYDEYGATFFNWVGFYATELGLGMGQIVRDDQAPETCEAATELALQGAPDALILVPPNTEAALCVVRTARGISPNIPIFLGDTGYRSDFANSLGAQAHGIRGTVPGPAPRSAFREHMRALLGHDGPPYASSYFDALQLLAIAHAGIDHSAEESLADSMIRLVQTAERTQGTVSAAEVARAMRAAARAEEIELAGATGSLLFDRSFQGELIASNFDLWEVKDGQLRVMETLDTAERGTRVGGERSAARTLPTLEVGGEPEIAAGQDLPALVGSKAVLVVGSWGWRNYRHQSDAFRLYHYLRSQGLGDDDILLLSADDVADSRFNRVPGVVRNVPGGRNLKEGLRIDADGQSLSADELRTHLLEQPLGPFSSEGDNVLVFLVGHGGSDGFYLSTATELQSTSRSGSLLSPTWLAETAQAMYDAGRYRKLVIIVEACHAGVLGTELAAPESFLLAGANPYENSLAANYDTEVRTWLADQFASSFMDVVESEPATTFARAYTLAYSKVPGSHVSLYFGRTYDGFATESVRDFLCGNCAR